MLMRNSAVFQAELLEFPLKLFFFPPSFNVKDLFVRDAIRLVAGKCFDFSALALWASIAFIPCPVSWIILLPMQAHSTFLFSALAVLFHSLHTCFLSLFPGGTGPTSDTGWGCMLRCGQMIFAQALVCRHLGRGKPENWLPGPCARSSAVLLRVAAGNCWGLGSFSLSFLKFRADVWKLYWKLPSRFLPAAVCSST